MMNYNEAAPEYMKSETAVFWDINRCPIPDSYDACRVGPRIDSVLLSLGYSGPLTIAAIGDLDDTPDEVLRALSSSGILVKEVPCGSMSVLGDMLDWKKNNPPPATIMLISDYRGVSTFSSPLRSLQAKGYNILMAYPHTLPRKPPGLVISAEWLWEPFLTDAMDSQETRRPEKKCSVDAFTCKSCTCDFASQSFEMFTDHLKSKEHAVNTLKHWSRKTVKPFKNKAHVPSRIPSVPRDLSAPRKTQPAETLEEYAYKVRARGGPSFPMHAPTPLKIYHREILKEFENMVREPRIMQMEVIDLPNRMIAAGEKVSGRGQAGEIFSKSNIMLTILVD